MKNEATTNTTTDTVTCEGTCGGQFSGTTTPEACCKEEPRDDPQNPDKYRKLLKIVSDDPEAPNVLAYIASTDIAIRCGRYFARARPFIDPSSNSRVNSLTEFYVMRCDEVPDTELSFHDAAKLPMAIMCHLVVMHVQDPSDASAYTTEVLDVISAIIWSATRSDRFRSNSQEPSNGCPIPSTESALRPRDLLEATNELNDQNQRRDG